MKKLIDLLLKYTVYYSVVIIIYRIYKTKSILSGLIEGLFILIFALLIELVVGFIFYLSIDQEVKTDIRNNCNKNKDDTIS